MTCYKSKSEQEAEIATFLVKVYQRGKNYIFVIVVHYHCCITSGECCYALNIEV